MKTSSGDPLPRPLCLLWQCQDVCRQGAIRLTNEYVPAAANRDALREEFGNQKTRARCRRPGH